MFYLTTHSTHFIYGVRHLATCCYISLHVATSRYMLLHLATSIGFQESHQDLADHLKLHVVELRADMDDVPVVVASPRNGHVTTQPVSEEDVSFENLYFRGRVPYVRPKPRPFYESLPFWRAKKFQLYKIRNQPACQSERKLYGMEPSNEEFQRRLRPLKASRES